MTRTSGDSTQRPARKIGCGLVPAATVIGAALLWGTLPSYNRSVRTHPSEDRHGQATSPPNRSEGQARHAGQAPDARSRCHARPRQGVGGRGHAGPDGASARPAGSTLGGSQAFGPGRPPGHRRSRQGRHDRQGHGGVQPAGLPGLLVQGADPGGARPRLPVAGPQARAGQGRDRRSSIGPTTRTCSWSASTASRRDACGRSATSRSTPSSERWPRAARPSSSSSCRSIATSSASASSRATTIPKKRWKFKLADLEERKLWDDYQAAFDDALSKTSTPWAPWYVIPANRNWLRNLSVATILADTIADLRPAYPKPADLPPNLIIE